MSDVVGYLRRRLKAAALVLVRGPARLCLRLLARLSTTAGERDLFLHTAELTRLPQSAMAEAGPEEQKRALVAALELHRDSERLINGFANLHYKGRHPKHHLWTEHNRFLYDECRPEDRVVDIGCGGSAYQEWIAGKVRCFVAVDIDPRRIEVAKRNHPNSPVEYRVMDVTTDLPAGEFDVAICSHVLEHLDDAVAFLRRLSELVDRVVIKVPLEDTNWIKVVRRDLGLIWLDDADHRREYTAELLAAQLAAAGWRIDKLIRGYDLRAAAHRADT
jgi:hypothetical protein